MGRSVQLCEMTGWLECLYFHNGISGHLPKMTRPTSRCACSTWWQSAAGVSSPYEFPPVEIPFSHVPQTSDMWDHPDIWGCLLAAGWCHEAITMVQQNRTPESRIGPWMSWPTGQDGALPLWEVLHHDLLARKSRVWFYLPEGMEVEGIQLRVDYCSSGTGLTSKSRLWLVWVQEHTPAADVFDALKMLYWCASPLGPFLD